MAALLVSLAVMSVLMGALLPAWRHQAQREKEAELVFRGEQYVRAIRLWERRMGPGSRPPNFDILVQQRFLRKKYKDPMTEDGEFQPLYVGTNLPGPAGAGRGGRGTSTPGPAGRSGLPPQPQVPQMPQQQPSGIGGTTAAGGIVGVTSKSKESSILIYKGRSHYNEWNFIYANASSAPGGAGNPMPGGRGGSPFPGGRGLPGRGPRRGIGGEQNPIITPGVVPPGGRGR